MTGFLVFAIIVVAIIVLFRYWRKREMEAFMGADVTDFEELSELVAKTQLNETDDNVVNIPAPQNRLPPAAEFALKSTVLDEVHRNCLQTLEDVVVDQYRILVHVPMQNIARAEQPDDEERLKRQSVSFVLCERTSMALVCGILLKGAGQTEVVRAEFLETVFRGIDRPLIVLPVASTYSSMEIREALAAVLENSPLERHCPKCGKEMMMRKAVRGRNAGKSFWVCREFPSCRGIMRI
ncbi:MAG: DUF2726 domain-containing protein [Pseudomonadales bacterium]|nr:DUF2726 domain-containing protein [Pseudomonadales bacterium]